MTELDIKKLISRLLLLVFIFTTLTILPTISFDPFNPPKLLVLSTFAGGIFGILVFRLTKEFVRNNFWTLIFLALFVLVVIVSTILSEQDLTTTLYGVGGRNTGVIYYISLSIIFLAATYVSSERFAQRFAQTVTIVGIFVILYSWIQILNLDLLPWSQEGWIMSFLANPNFVSAWIGMSTAPAFAILFNSIRFNLVKILLFAYILVAVLTIMGTDSIQGYIVTAISLFSTIYFKINSDKKLVRFKKTYVTFVIIFFIWLVLDILQKTPGDSFLYKPSVASRGDFWRAAWNMGLDKPFLGWGLDSLRDRFTVYRDYNQAIRGEGHQLGEIAHNVFLDLFVGGGFALLLVYLLLILTSFINVRKKITNLNEFNSGFVTVFSMTLGYIAQSIISANHLGLGLIGWICFGLLAGLESDRKLNIKNQIQITPSSNFLVNYTRMRSKTRIQVSLILAAIMGFVIALPLFLVNVKQQTAANNQSADQYLSAALTWPKDSIRMSLLAERLLAGGYTSQAVTILEEAIKVTPYSSIPLKVMLGVPGLDEKSKAELLKKIITLDPYYLESMDARNKLEQ
jgi:O-antigen ligase